MAMMFATSMQDSPFTKASNELPDPVLLKQRVDYNKLQRQKKMGLKEFTIDGITVLALNYKNAVKKANKIRWKKS